MYYAEYQSLLSTVTSSYKCKSAHIDNIDSINSNYSMLYYYYSQVILRYKIAYFYNSMHASYIYNRPSGIK